MPRADGTLYNFEKAALEPRPVKQAKKPKAKPPRPKAEPQPKQPLPTLDQVVAEVEQRQIDKGGRPVGSGLRATPEVIEKVLSGIRRNLTIEKSMILAGVRRTTFDRWKRVNQSLFALFEQAEVEAEANLVDCISKFAPSDWKAASWTLERRHSWHPVGRTELTGANGGPIAALTLSKQLLGSIAQGDGEEKVAKAKRVSPVIDITPAGEKQSPAKPS